MASSLSAGKVIHELLSQSEDLRSEVTQIFPVWTDKALLPYIAYRKSSIKHDPTKSSTGADTVVIELACYHSTYAGVVSLAEKVRNALDYKTGTFSINGESLKLRGCYLSGAGPDTYSGDAYIQTLFFTLKI